MADILAQYLSKSDAIILLGALSAITGIVVAWMKATTIPDWIKFIILCSISGAGGFLSAYTTGAFDISGLSIVATGSIIYTFGRAFYYAAFQFLNLQSVLWPKGAVMNAAKADVGTQLSNMTNETAKAVLDPSQTLGVSVQTKIEAEPVV